MLILGFLLKSWPFSFSKYVGRLKRKMGKGRVVCFLCVPYSGSGPREVIIISLVDMEMIITSLGHRAEDQRLPN